MSTTTKDTSELDEAIEEALEDVDTFDAMVSGPCTPS